MLKLQFKNAPESKNIQVKLNGKLVGNSVQVNNLVSFDIAADLITQGRNTVEVLTTATETLLWTDLYLQQQHTN